MLDVIQYQNVWINFINLRNAFHEETLAKLAALTDKKTSYLVSFQKYVF